MTLDDISLYRPAWGPLHSPTIRSEKQYLFTNLILTYFLMGYDSGLISETELRVYLSRMFMGEVARRYWHTARDTWIATGAQQRRMGRFIHVIEEQYKIALDAGPPVVSDTVDETLNEAPAVKGLRKNWRTPMGSLVGLSIGVVLGARLRRGVRRSLPRF